MSIDLMNRVWRNPAIDDRSDVLLLLALADQANDDGVCWPGIDTIAARSRSSRSTVIRKLREFESKGWIVIHKEPGRSNRYRVTPPVPPRDPCHHDTPQSQVDPCRGDTRCMVTPVSPGDTGGVSPGDTGGVSPGDTRTINNHQGITTRPDAAVGGAAQPPAGEAAPRGEKPRRKADPVVDAATNSTYEAIDKAANWNGLRTIARYALVDRQIEAERFQELATALHRAGRPITKQTIAQAIDGSLRLPALDTDTASTSTPWSTSSRRYHPSMLDEVIA